MLQRDRSQLERLVIRIANFTSKPRVNTAWYSFVVFFFVLLVLLPTIFVLGYVILEFTAIQNSVFSNQEIQSQILSALFYSISVSIIVSIFDLIFGLPIAWTLVRKEFRFKSLLNSFIELPLAVPTAGLGFSVALFWGVTPGVESPIFAVQFIRNALPMLILFHFTTTFPYVVRSLTAILEEIDVTLEVAARTCGASKFTAARTVTLPMFRSGVATAMVLSLAKSLSDTGGVVVLLSTIGSAARTGTTLISDWKRAHQDPEMIPFEGIPYDSLLPSMAFLAAIMIGIAITLVFVAKIIAKKAQLPFRKVYPSFEWAVSEGKAPQMRQIIAFGFLILFVIIPSFFLVAYLIQGASLAALASANWELFGQSIFMTVLVASVATVVNVVLGVPMAILIARKSHTFSRFLDALVDIPYVVPSSALGFSVGLFWAFQPVIPVNELFFVIMAHISMTFPFIVRNTVGGLEELDTAYEDVARTLGAKPMQTFREITFPVIKFSIIAGAIMSFTRSVGETGATLAVSPTSTTAPVFIVNLIKIDQNYFLAALTTIILILISSMLIFTLRASISRAKRK
ncbi:molybdenum transporter permease [Candidatus Heimdallarchaeota archaeon B3_Heim]|nr:MAG: molybdenum transporter permease [Candidatus Heimdallarchaeota archaeon B3_Heim]